MSAHIYGHTLTYMIMDEHINMWLHGKILVGSLCYLIVHLQSSCSLQHSVVQASSIDSTFPHNAINGHINLTLCVCTWLEKNAFSVFLPFFCTVFTSFSHRFFSPREPKPGTVFFSPPELLDLLQRHIFQRFWPFWEPFFLPFSHRCFSPKGPDWEPFFFPWEALRVQKKRRKNANAVFFLTKSMSKVHCKI